ncbi:MAG: prepilin peptidase, partial [Myxococcaceae bacterium]|nr:prepilin peptidase [Myxococcaceae bacterium]
PIPDEPAVAEGEEEGEEWTPGVTNLPFGPWLALGAVEVMLLGPWLRENLPPGFALLLGGG